MKIPSHSQEKFSIEHGSESINETKQDATFHVVQEPRSYVHLQKEEPHNIKPDTRDIRTINTDQDHNENSLLTANTPPANIYNEPLVQEEHNTTVIPDHVHLENPQDCSHITPVVNELPSPRDEQVQLAVVDTNDTVAEPPKDQQTDEQPSKCCPIDRGEISRRSAKRGIHPPNLVLECLQHQAHSQHRAVKLLPKCHHVSSTNPCQTLPGISTLKFHPTRTSQRWARSQSWTITSRPHLTM